MVDLGNLLGIIGGIAGIIVLFTGALVFVRGSYNKARIEALRADIADYKSREESHDREIGECNHKIGNLQQRCDHLESENITLRDLVTQRAAVEGLAAALTEHHRESLEAWKAIQVAIEKSIGNAH